MGTEFVSSRTRIPSDEPDADRSDTTSCSEALQPAVAANPSPRHATVQRRLESLGKTIVTDYSIAQRGASNCFSCAVADRGCAERRIRRAPIEFGHTEVEVLTVWMHEGIWRAVGKPAKT